MRLNNLLCCAYVLSISILILFVSLFVVVAKDYHKINTTVHKQYCDILNYTTNTVYYEYSTDNHYNEIITGKSKYVNGATIFEIRVLYTNNITESFYTDGYITIQTRNAALAKLRAVNQTTCYYNPFKKILHVTKNAIIRQYKYDFNFGLGSVIVSLFITITYTWLIVCNCRLPRKYQPVTDIPLTPMP